jgi:hypothetical protein
MWQANFKCGAQSAWRRTNPWSIDNEVPVVVHKPLRTNGKLDAVTADNSSGCKLQKLGVETKFLVNTGILARCQPRAIPQFRTRNGHLPQQKIKAVALR